MNHAELKERIQDEFRNFKIPDPGFRGGRFQTSIIEAFAHVDAEGKLRKIEVRKPGGSRYFLSV